MSQSEPTYLTSVKGSKLTPGQVIICNQAYGEILSLSPDYIITNVGSRAFYPDHLYPVFSNPYKGLPHD